MGVLLIGIWRLTLKRRGTPRGFALYGLVLGLMAITTLWSVDAPQSVWWLMLYTTGGVMWLSAFRQQKEVSMRLSNYILMLTAGFAGLWGMTQIIGRNFLGFGSQSLVVWGSAFNNHNHLGDLAALAMVVCLDKARQNRWWWLGVVLLGGLVAMSLSRSAYVILALGILIRVREQRYLKLLMVLLLLGFVSSTTNKGIFSSRDYWIQAVMGVVVHPLGVGMGNFHVFSSDSQYQLGIFTGFSYVTHNITLDFMAGMGVLGLVMVAWLIVMLMEVMREKLSLNAVMWLMLTLNFLLDSTYQIPTMVWLWFMLLGAISQTARRHWPLLEYGVLGLLAISIGYYIPIIISL